MQQYQKRHGNMIGHMWLIVSILTICGSMANSLRINSNDNRMDRTFHGDHRLAELIINQRLKRSGSNGNGPCGTGNKGDVGCPCTTNTDCSTNICHQGKCKPSTCFDNIRNSHETDVDCGGGTCSGCADGKICKVGTDCNSGDCQSGKCKSLVTCGTCVVNNFGGYTNDDRCSQVCAAAPIGAVASANDNGGDGAALFHNVTSGSSGSPLDSFRYGFSFSTYDYITNGGNALVYGYSADDPVGRVRSLDGTFFHSYTYRDYTFNVYGTAVTYTGSCARISANTNCGSDGIFAFPCGGGVGYCCCGITK